tara:strand:- start:603 stop:2003 length:1401 start_codon:yes stop_codon:yes gene_type:complete
MKNFTLILILLFFQNNITFASDYSNSMLSFNLWLKNNGYSYRVGCDNKKTRNALCYDENGNPLWEDKENNLKVNAYKGRWSVPFNKNPNRDTLVYYNYKNLFSHETGDGSTIQWKKYLIQASKDPYEFKFNKIENEFIKKQFMKQAILSYLYFQDGQIIIDELSPIDRFGEFVNNDTKLRSNSMGKSLASYVLGHAICAGYIKDVNQRISDWPLVKDTIYQDDKLIDLLNMNAGDQKYVYDSVILEMGDVEYQTVEGEADTNTIAFYMGNYFKNKKKSDRKYNYNVINTHLILNYAMFKSGDNWQKLLNNIFQVKAKVKNSVYFFKVPNKFAENGDAQSMFYATRYDYLRVAKTIMDDWQNDTCVGKYLKTIYNNRIEKKLTNPKRSLFRVEEATYSYGGQFHLDIKGMKDRKILGIGGHGGQQILIDVENSRIVVLNTIHVNRKKYNYNWKKMVYNIIKDGVQIP